MGITTLRRRHPAADPRQREAALHVEDERVRERAAAMEPFQVAFDAARTASLEATEAHNAAPDNPELTAAAEAAEAAAVEAQEALNQAQTEFDNAARQEALYADAPKRGANKATWIDYAAAHGRPVEGLKHPDETNDAGEVVTPGKPFTVAEIAELFLGPKA